MADQSAPVAPSTVAQLLRATAAALTAELAALPAAALAWHPAPNEWCVKEVLGHLIEAEQRGFAGRIRILLKENEPKLETWDPPTVAKERRDCERDVGALLREFMSLREASVALVAGLKEADLQRGGRHPQVGYLKVGELLYEWIHHDRNHLKQILTNVQAFVWPHMGNAQRFSG